MLDRALLRSSLARADWTACAVLALALCARGQGLTERVSVGSLGEQGDATSGLSSSASADGRYVAFDSSASTLVPGDTNGHSEVFLRDRASGQTWRVSVGPGGVQANGFSDFCSLSADGGAVAFTSQASNLVPGDTNGFSDVFVVDLQSGQLARVSVAAGGAQASEGSLDGELSADGRFVAYQSLAADLVPGDTNGFDDVFVHDRQTGQVVRASVGAAGGQGSGWSGAPSISADGRYVAFASRAPDLLPGDTNGVEDVFVKDLVTGTLVRASTDSAGGQASLGGSDAALSGDGRCVAFTSLSADLVAGDTNGLVDVFVKDLFSGATRRASVGSSGQQANGQSIEPALSTDGALVAFRSFAANLVPGDTNSVSFPCSSPLVTSINFECSICQ